MKVIEWKRSFIVSIKLDNYLYFVALVVVVLPVKLGARIYTQRFVSRTTGSKIILYIFNILDDWLKKIIMSLVFNSRR